MSRLEVCGGCLIFNLNSSVSIGGRRHYRSKCSKCGNEALVPGRRRLCRAPKPKPRTWGDPGDEADPSA